MVAVMRDVDVSLRKWVQVVRGELEIPGLQLTGPQVQRLWGLDNSTCTAVLETLVGDRFLRETNGRYARLDSWGPSRRVMEFGEKLAS
jgi:hypothetical protein